MALGFPHPDHLEEQLSARQLDEWKEWVLRNPVGERRADLRTGILAALIANVNRNPDKTPEPFAPSDFMPNFERVRTPPVPKKQTAEEMKRILQGLVKASKPKKSSRRRKT